MTSPNAGLLADLDQLAAGGQDDHPRPRPDQHPVAPDRGEQGDLLRAERGAGAQRGRAGRRGPRPPGGRTRRCAPAGGSSTRATPRSVSSSGITASAPAGIGAPVMIRMASPGPMPERVFAPAATSPTTGSVDRLVRAGVAGVDRRAPRSRPSPSCRSRAAARRRRRSRRAAGPARRAGSARSASIDPMPSSTIGQVLVDRPQAVVVSHSGTPVDADRSRCDSPAGSRRRHILPQPGA